METLVELAILLSRFLFRRSPARTVAASYACVIGIGSVLLALPFSSHDGRWTSPVDALFTATSAVCVTGLTVKSTAYHWSPFGQFTILALIQIGGLGIMAIGAFVAVLVPRRLFMRFGTVMADMVEADRAESIWALIRFILLFTIVAELLGAVALFFSWRSHFETFGQCAYHSVFHSISAFCNAGFSLNDESLIRYVSSVGVNVVICFLIILGGLGFTVVGDVANWSRWWLFGRKGRRPQLSAHSRLVLTVTSVLILLGFLGVLIIESHGSLAQAPLKTKVLASLFQSVTPRTAGFCTMDMSRAAANPISLATVFLIIVLMYIGGSPGGTAGGIKTTTLGIMVASIRATLKGRPRAELFQHTVPPQIVHRVASIILLSLAALAAAIFLLLMTEKAAFEEVVFDAVSAFGTVGLSIGLTGPTATITWGGKLILSALMFVGRIGPVGLVLSVAYLKDTTAYRYPEEHIMVG